MEISTPPLPSPVTPTPFAELTQVWRSQPYGPVLLDYQHLVQHDPTLNFVLGHSACVTWIYDVRTLGFVYVSNNARRVLGYEAQQYLEGGIEFVNAGMHPEDLPVFWRLMKRIWDFLLALPAWQRKQYRFTCDYRLRKPDGGYARILDQTSVLQLDGQGHITHLLGTSSDISCWKKGGELVASLLSPEDGACWFYTPEEEKLQPSPPLSKRELEIVKLLADGCSSKFIAQQLSLSFHTVNTHRQKMITKTNTKNTSGVVQFALSHGLI
jgi:DNA-binding CsgD family transcriptional regulator